MKGERFGHQFADEHLKISDAGEGESEGCDAAVEAGVRKPPIQPRARLQSVTPSCTAGRKSPRFSCSFLTRRARASPV